ncbi:MAG TPA: Gfo/Idh/MocA family oxidoreductase [Bryobacteraceae bacterium]|nr:Gfo/Idh/MocA family oxidoreductase [Bryobacteraceae bacterium]
MAISATKFAVIGCGLIGTKRAQNIPGSAVITVCCDANETNANKLAASCPGATTSTDWKCIVGRADVDAVFVCTTHDLLAPVAEAAALHGKHVLIEKPGARRANELDPVFEASKRTGAVVRVGFNHRYHRAFQRAREIYQSGMLSDLLFVRGRYGHGGRIGYDQEWRALPAISGGGEAIDQGIHLIDLARWFLGDLNFVGGRAPTYFWNMPVEDNAFLLLESESRQVAFLHASWTEWKNLFSFEICGRMGKLEISGLGGSYGAEKLLYYQMLPEMGPPETTIYEYPMGDNSWQVEIAEFIDDIELRRTPEPGLREAQAALRIVEQLYTRQ